MGKPPLDPLDARADIGEGMESIKSGASNKNHGRNRKRFEAGTFFLDFMDQNRGLSHGT